MTQIPIVNVNNNCSTGSTAIYLARQAIEGGLVECAMAMGFEKMFTGSLRGFFPDRTPPGDWRSKLMKERRGIDPKAPPASQTFGNAGIEYCEVRHRMPRIVEQRRTHLEHRVDSSAMAPSRSTWPRSRKKTTVVSRNHSVTVFLLTTLPFQDSALNPYSQFQDVHTLDQVVNSRKIFGPLTVLQCCPTSDGAGAVILASEEFVRKHGLEPQAIEIAAQVMATDTVTPVKTKSSMEVAGFSMTKKAAGAFPSSPRIIRD